MIGLIFQKHELCLQEQNLTNSSLAFLTAAFIGINRVHCDEKISLQQETFIVINRDPFDDQRYF